MPDSATSGRRDRREARRQHRRSRVRVVALAVVALLVVTGLTVAVTGLVSFGGDDTERAAGTVRVAPAGASQPTTTSTTAPKHSCRALSTDEPLRLWVGGDSLAGSLGPALGQITGATGVVQPYFDSRVSSGLSNRGFFDWPDHAATEMTRLDPEIVVFIIGTNDYTTPTDDDGWKAEYTKRVEEMLSVLDRDGRTVYWVGAPILKDDDMDLGAVGVNAVAAGVVAKHPNAEYVDAHELFADTDGTYAQHLPDETGKVVTMRAGDGVHLTTDGGDHLGRAVYALLDAQCRITAQQVEGHDRATIQTEGSTRVAGSSGNGSTVQTTPPYSSPSTTTTPPTTTTPTTTTTPATTTTTTTLAPAGQQPGT